MCTSFFLTYSTPQTSDRHCCELCPFYQGARAGWCLLVCIMCLTPWASVYARVCIHKPPGNNGRRMKSALCGPIRPLSVVVSSPPPHPLMHARCSLGPFPERMCPQSSHRHALGAELPRQLPLGGRYGPRHPSPEVVGRGGVLRGSNDLPHAQTIFLPPKSSSAEDLQRGEATKLGSDTEQATHVLDCSASAVDSMDGPLQTSNKGVVPALPCPWWFHFALRHGYCLTMLSLPDRVRKLSDPRWCDNMRIGPFCPSCCPTRPAQTTVSAVLFDQVDNCTVQGAILPEQVSTLPGPSTGMFTKKSD